MNLDRIAIENVVAERCMSWSDVAFAAGISRQNLCVVLKRGSCTTKTAGKLAKGLNVNVDDLRLRERK